LGFLLEVVFGDIGPKGEAYVSQVESLGILYKPGRYVVLGRVGLVIGHQPVVCPPLQPREVLNSDALVKGFMGGCVSFVPSIDV